MAEPNHQSDLEPVVRVLSQVPSQQPGSLRSDASITLQTRHAQKLVIGRKRQDGVEPIIGMLEFGRRVKNIWTAAQYDDPYADWFLKRIEDSIDETRSMMDQKMELLKSILDSMDGFQISIAQSVEPINVPIHFSQPYGYMGATLIAKYDTFCCAMLTARHCGVVDRSYGEKGLYTIARTIRRTFLYSYEWRYMGVSREDCRQMNQIAQRAIDAMGSVPDPILALKTRARNAPIIQASTMNLDSAGEETPVPELADSVSSGRE